MDRVTPMTWCSLEIMERGYKWIWPVPFFYNPTRQCFEYRRWSPKLLPYAFVTFVIYPSVGLIPSILTLLSVSSGMAKLSMVELFALLFIIPFIAFGFIFDIFCFFGGKELM